MSRIHRTVYRRSEGIRGASAGMKGRPVALITTVGRRAI